MIKETELRIGNLLKTPKGILRIESLNFKNSVKNKKCYYATFEENNAGYFLYNCEPVPITEELLLKLGAIKIHFKDLPSFNLFGIQINYVDGIWIEYVSRIEVKGLDSLQNIYFFRKNEELDVNNLF